MKKLILQKEFIFDLFCLTNSGCEVTDDLTDFLITDYTGYDLICDFDSYQEYELAALQNPILEAILDKFQSITYTSDLETKLQNNEFYDSLSTVKNVFLTNVSVEKCEKLSQERGYIYVSNVDISLTWNLFSKFRKRIDLKVTTDKKIDEIYRFDTWSKMQELSHPLKSVIIFDKHLLCISPDDVELNIAPLIINLLKHTNEKRKLSVTIISEIKIGFPLKAYKEKIETCLKKANYLRVNLNIIRHNKAFYPKKGFEGLHARFILTNYLHVISDAGFNYFKKNGNIENVANITASLNLYAFSEKSYNKDLNDLKFYLSRIVENPKSNDLKYSDVYFPDKLNPLLN